MVALFMGMLIGVAAVMIYAAIRCYRKKFAELERLLAETDTTDPIAALCANFAKLADASGVKMAELADALIKAANASAQPAISFTGMITPDNQIRPKETKRESNRRERMIQRAKKLYRRSVIL